MATSASTTAIPERVVAEASRHDATRTPRQQFQAVANATTAPSWASGWRLGMHTGSAGLPDGPAVTATARQQVQAAANATTSPSWARGRRLGLRNEESAS